ncbi:hypothetical protein [Nocardioides sp. P5_C9_2]
MRIDHPEPPEHVGRGLPVLLTAAVVLAAVLVRLRFLSGPLAPDEAGFLMVGGQWAPGTSLYGDYWVDRPPGLVALSALADLLGGGVALRLLGATAAVAAIVLAALLGRRLAPAHRWSGPACALLAAALLSNPLLAVREVGGEVLALPFLLAGAWMLLTALVRRSRGWAFGAGMAGAAAASVKQNLVDVLVLAVLLALALVVAGRWRRAVWLLAWCAAGAAALTAVVLALSATRGTSPGGIWEAVVVFRVHATEVIASEASSATGVRRGWLVEAFVASGAPIVLLLLIRLPWRPDRGDAVSAYLTWVVSGLLVWEALSVAAGGSYWLHYLVGVVPGLVLVLALGLRRRSAVPVSASGRSLVTVALVAVVASAVIGLGVVSARPEPRQRDEQAVIDYLRAHREGPRTGVVAFGDASLLEAAGLRSPYPYLWSLPVRVRDPGLRLLDRVLRSDAAPTWIVRHGPSLASWGIDAGRADEVLGRRYTEVFSSGDFQVLARRSEPPGGAAGTVGCAVEGVEADRAEARPGAAASTVPPGVRRDGRVASGPGRSWTR